MWCLSQLGLILYTLKLKPLSQLFQALLHQSDYLKSRWKPRQGEESTADIGPLTRKQNKSKLLSFPGLKGRLDFGGSTPKFSVAVVGHDRPTQARGDLNLTRQAPEEQWLLSALWTGQGPTASEGRSHPSTELLPWRFPMLYLSLLLVLFIPHRKLLFAEGHCLAHAHLCESHSDPQTLCLQQQAHGLENTAGLNQRLVFSWSPAAP